MVQQECHLRLLPRRSPQDYASESLTLQRPAEVISFGIPQRIPQEDLVRLLVEGEVNYAGLDFEFWRGPGKGIIRAYEIKSDGNVHIGDYDPLTGLKI
ncbi:hypothetical protein KA107_03580 [Candidatus Pacearchaeota archaeon]|nr:hypothetical protein [Candidatus Pacearchaeota archaeon]